MTVNIQLEWTPNPSTLKYVVDTALLPRGAMNFTDKALAAEKSPLVSKLFGIKGVQAVMLGTNFVTVTKGEDGEWDELNEGVMSMLDQHLTAGEEVVKPEFLENKTVAPAGSSEIEKKILEILENEIRPAVAMDGGDITLDRFEDGIVYLHMKGSCSGCPSSTATLKAGIETRLREAIPEVAEVVAL